MLVFERTVNNRRTGKGVAGANENMKIVLAILVFVLALCFAIITFGHLVYHAF